MEKIYCNVIVVAGKTYILRYNSRHFIHKYMLEGYSVINHIHHYTASRPFKFIDYYYGMIIQTFLENV